MSPQRSELWVWTSLVFGKWKLASGLGVLEWHGLRYAKLDEWVQGKIGECKPAGSSTPRRFASAGHITLSQVTQGPDLIQAVFMDGVGHADNLTRVKSMILNIPGLGETPPPGVEGRECTIDQQAPATPRHPVLDQRYGPDGSMHLVYSTTGADLRYYHQFQRAYGAPRSGHRLKMS